MPSLGNKATQIDLAYQKDRTGGAALVAKQGIKTEIDTGQGGRGVDGCTSYRGHERYDGGSS